MESCAADWQATNSKVADVPAEVKDPSVDVLEMEDFALLIERDAGWAKDVGSVDPRPCKRYGQYRSELAAIKVLILCTYLEVSRIDRESSSANNPPRAHVGHAESPACEAQVAREATDVKLVRANNIASDLVELRRRPVTTNVSGQKVMAELLGTKLEVVN